MILVDIRMNEVNEYMSIIGNLIWLLCGGLLSGLGWILSGCLWCITIIGIPIGLQCFKFATLSFAPFGKEVRYGSSFGNLIVNVIWIIITGIPLAIISVITGCLLCLTIVGIPFGLQHFKIAKLGLMPFGATIN